MKKFKLVLIVFIIISAIVLCAAAFLFYYFFMGKTQAQSDITWGVDFSQMQAESLKLDWKDLYSAILNDLGAKRIKIHTQWDWVEGKRGDFFYNDIDWQIKQAEQKNAKVIYVLGMKTGRWPECHLPSWANNLPEETVKAELLKYIKEVVLRYKGSKSILYWQVENEPLFKFGECPSWYYKNDSFLKEEVNLVKSLDPSRKIIISDSGEQSTWFGAAKVGDIVGITMYRNVWAHITDTFGFEAYSFLNPAFYARKADIIKQKFDKKVICIELQAEPWASKPFSGSSLQEQFKSMNPQMFQENIQFAKKTGLDTFYFWGAEWWYWLKTKQNQPEIWNQAKELFQS